MKKIYEKKEGEKDKINIYSISNCLIPSLAMASTNDINPLNMVIKTKTIKDQRMIIKEIIHENYDLEVENDLERIKIQWEKNSDNVEVNIKKDLDKSA